MVYIRVISACVLVIFSFIRVGAQTEEIHKTLNLDSVMVRGHHVNSGVKTDVLGVMSMDMSLMDRMPKILGNADPMRYAQMLAGVQTSSEYLTGINIEGCENQHNNINVNGVPLYNVYHLFGLFSVFNSTHYQSLDMQHSAVSALTANRLGGTMTMTLPDRVPEKTSGSLAVGLMSSQGTLRVPLGSKSALFISGRASYMNLLYSRWLKVEDSQVKYSFGDANVTYLYTPTDRDALWFDGYYGIDDADYSPVSSTMVGVDGDWGNRYLAGHWKHTTRYGMTHQHSLYVTNSYADMALSYKYLDIRTLASLTDIGYNLSVNMWRFNGAFEFVHHRVKPQRAFTNDSEFLAANRELPVQDSHELSLALDYNQPLGKGLDLVAGVRGSSFVPTLSHYMRSMYVAVDPSLSLRYQRGIWQSSVNLNSRHQYMHETGLSVMGMPTQYWMPSSKDIRPQYSYNATLVNNFTFSNGHWAITTELFYKRLYNQTQYYGSPYALVNSVYDLNKHLCHGWGENYGVMLMLNKRLGKVTGWLSYTYTCARRKFEEFERDDWFPASHERPHEFNLVVSWNVSSRIKLGATAVVASGTAFTAPSSMYLYQGNIVETYGRFNANRLRPYTRLDLSFDYMFHTRCFKESGINFSLYNAQGTSNEIFKYLKKYKDHVRYRPFHFMLPIMPSLSYYIKF